MKPVSSLWVMTPAGNFFPQKKHHGPLASGGPLPNTKANQMLFFWKITPTGFEPTAVCRGWGFGFRAGRAGLSTARP